MNFVGIILTIFILIDVFYKPQSNSLKTIEQTSLLKRIQQTKGTLFLGILLAVISWISLDSHHYYQLKPEYYWMGLNKHFFFDLHGYFELITSSFFHFDIIHLLGNLSVLLLFAPYERRVGWKRYFIVFAVAALGSSLMDILILTDNQLSLGASGGIAGLAMGYFMDYANVTLKEWIIGSVMVIILIAVLSFVGQHQTGMTVNWIAHLVGAFSSVILIRIFPLQSNVGYASRPYK